MIKPRLLVDCDGVLADYHQAMLNVLNACGFAYRRSDVTAFDHEKWMCEDALKLFNQIVNDEHTGYDFYRDLELLPRAERLLPGGDLYNCFDVRYVTASNKTPAWIKARYEWFVDHGVNPAKQVIFCATEEKQHIDGAYLIDDNLDVVNSWSRDSERYWRRVSILVDAPWNRGKLLGENDQHRLSSTSDACAFLDLRGRHAALA